MRVVSMVWIALAGCGEEQRVSGRGPGPGEYDDGVYHCCAEGQGTACCGGYEPGMCFEFGGIYGACVPEGEEMEAKILCAMCCPGLEAVGQSVPTGQSGCDPGDAPPSMLICVACGDGACGPGENACRCPEDCSAQ